MKPVVFTQGSFDLLHHGHVAFLERAARLGTLYVSLLTAAAYEAYRGYPPVMPWADRAAVLRAMSCVAAVFPGDNRQTSEELLRSEATIAVVGSDWLDKDIYAQWRVSQDWLDAQGITLCYLPYTEGVSSTGIKERIVTA